MPGYDRTAADVRTKLGPVAYDRTAADVRTRLARGYDRTAADVRSLIWQSEIVLFQNGSFASPMTGVSQVSHSGNSNGLWSVGSNGITLRGKSSYTNAQGTLLLASNALNVSGFSTVTFTWSGISPWWSDWHVVLYTLRDTTNQVGTGNSREFSTAIASTGYTADGSTGNVGPVTSTLSTGGYSTICLGFNATGPYYSGDPYTDLTVSKIVLS